MHKVMQIRGRNTYYISYYGLYEKEFHSYAKYWHPCCSRKVGNHITFTNYFQLLVLLQNNKALKRNKNVNYISLPFSKIKFSLRQENSCFMLLYLLKFSALGIRQILKTFTKAK